MKLPGFAPVGDFLLATRAFARTTVLFRFGGQRAVATRVRGAMEVEREPHGRLAGREREIWRVARAVWRAKRVWPGKPMCLQTSLVMQDVLRRRGFTSTLEVGVGRSDDLVKAHAWVIVGDFVIDDSRLHRGFAPLPKPRLPDEARAR
jgi:hypothetical protein